MKRLSYFILSGLFSAGWVGCFNDKLSSIVSDVEYADGISRCTEVAARILFTPSNDVSIIVSNRSRRSLELAREIIPKTFANKSVKLFTEFPTFRSNFLHRNPSFVVIESNANLYRRMSNPLAKRWAQYIIIVSRGTTKWLEKFANYLSNLQFLNATFVHAKSKARSVLVRLMENSSSRNSAQMLKIFDICNASATSPTKIEKILHDSFRVGSPSTKRELTFARIVENAEEVNDTKMAIRGQKSRFGVDVLRLYTDKKNIKLVSYEWPNQSSSSWTDAMKRCLANEFDFFYAVLPPSVNVANEDIEATAWYKYESLTFVDRPREAPFSLTDILIPYRGIVWLCTLATFAAFALFAYSINKLWREGLIRERLTVLHVWSIFVDHSLPSLPVKLGLRFVVGMWILHNLMRNSGYTAVFSSSLTATDGSHLLKSFQDIVDSGRPVCGSRKAKGLLNDPTDSAIYAVYKKFEVVKPLTVFNAVFNKNYIGTRHMTFIERYNKLNRANESLRLYTLSEATIIMYPSFYFSKKHNPHNDELKKIISRAHDVGLVAHIDKKYAALLDKISYEMPISLTDHYLRLNHLLFLFQLLCFGHIVSFFVFLIEICLHAKSVKKIAEKIVIFINFLCLFFSRR